MLLDSCRGATCGKINPWHRLNLMAISLVEKMVVWDWYPYLMSYLFEKQVACYLFF